MWYETLEVLLSTCMPDCWQCCILELFAFTLMKSVSYVYPDFPSCVRMHVCVGVYVSTRVCARVCLCACMYLCVSVCCASSVSSTYPPSPFQSFPQYIQLSSLWCLSNKTVPSTALEWISLIISFRLLLCLKTWGPGRQEEKNVNLQGVPVVCWEYCLGEAKKLPLDLLMATQGIDERCWNLPAPVPVMLRPTTWKREQLCRSWSKPDLMADGWLH